MAMSNECVLSVDLSVIKKIEAAWLSDDIAVPSLDQLQKLTTYLGPSCLAQKREANKRAADMLCREAARKRTAEDKEARLKRLTT